MIRLRREFPDRKEALDVIDKVPCELSERMGTCAGKAFTQRAFGEYKPRKIQLNARLLAINPDELIPTYLHELAHIVANIFAGRQIGHKDGWKRIMRVLGVSDERCHSMDVSAFKRHVPKFSYQCVECPRKFELSKVRHTKYQEHIARGIRFYRCKCGGTIEHKP